MFFRISIIVLAALSFVTLCFSACGHSSQQEVTPTPIGTATPSSETPSPDVRVFYVAPEGNDLDAGTIDRPWATINHAAEVLRAGDTVYVREGEYQVTRQIRPQNSGTADAWIVYSNYSEELVIIDARDIRVGPRAGVPPYPQDQGAFQIEGVSHIRVRGLVIKNSHNAGFTVRDSHHIELHNNGTDTTFSSGIAVWDTNHDGQGTHHIKVIGNTVVHANTWDMLPEGSSRRGETPHEAISIAGAHHFEVAHNHVYDCNKEGIDVKETSKHGTVHHNHVHHVDRQGLYVDSWFGKLEDIELYENVVHDCRGAGLVLSVENGELVNDVRIHHNLIYYNRGSGIFFSRWGDGPRKNVRIYNNTVHGNGYGQPNSKDTHFFWLTGGLYLYSTNLEAIDIRSNILSDNRGFQIGYSDHYLDVGEDVDAVFQQKSITVAHNLIYDRNDVKYPIYVGWPPDDYANVYAAKGDDYVEGDPLFVDPRSGNFYLAGDSPAIDGGSPESDFSDGDGTRNDIGAYPFGAEQDLWWQGDFPPHVQ